MFRYLTALLVSGIVVAAAPEDKPQFNVITLSAAVHREVPNDQASAVLYVESSDIDPVALADRTNATIAAGLKMAKAYAAVNAHAGGNNTYPVYGNNGKQNGWRAHADIRLESTDVKPLAELIARLQVTMQLGGITFSLSPAAKDQVDSAMIDEAIAAFRARAEIVRKSLGGAAYRIVNMSVNTQDGGVIRPMVAFRAKAEMSTVAPPPLEAGDSQITVEVSGAIQVQ